jgi:hypothetical protein
MQAFPETAEAFYALRDDRTDRCVEPFTEGRAYQRKHVAVVVDPVRAATTAGRAMLNTVTALLARWCRVVTVVSAPSSSVDSALAAMRDADPYGAFGTALTIPVNADFVLHLGGHGHADAVLIDGSGWIAQIGPANVVQEGLNDAVHPLGALAAACLGVAEVFRRSVGLPPLDAARMMDLYDLRWTNTSTELPVARRDIGNVLLVGAGAVGSGLAYALACSGFIGCFTIIDYDRIKIENFNRSPLCSCSTHNVLKADAVAQTLLAAGSAATPFPGSWDDFVHTGQLGAHREAIWVPVANEGGVRSAVQRNFPPIAVHGSTSVNWSVNYGRHQPGTDDCFLCRFPTQAAPPAALACSTSAVPVSEGVTVDAALPFASLLAAVFIAAELARRTVSDYVAAQPNFAKFDFYPGGFSLETQQRAPLSSCDCPSQLALSRFVNAISTPASNAAVLA